MTSDPVFTRVDVIGASRDLTDWQQLDSAAMRWGGEPYTPQETASSATVESTSPQNDKSTSFRLDIQGLRAVAVFAVLIFHFWPMRLPGGYVGVDVFFVISGFLITQHMVKEVSATGKLSLGNFWARRVRRLLPASLLVLALSALAVVVILPATTWGQTARQIIASALYVQNWALALESVEYMAADNAPTVVQQYWSLSVEEQFYVLWPLLVVGLISLGGASRGRSGSNGLPWRRALLLGVGVLSLASFSWSALSTGSNGSIAYFSTLTRVWEFGVGALAALVVVRRHWPPFVRSLLGWLGLTAILSSAFVLTSDSRFPGWIALVPVLGTVAVIAAGGSRSRGGSSALLSSRGLVFLGGISYAIYLWHWPILVLAPTVLGRPLFWPDKILLIALTCALAWVTKVVVEDPLRTRPILAASSWRSLVFAVVGTCLVVGCALGMLAELDRRQARDPDLDFFREDAAVTCVGPNALLAGSRCPDMMGDGALAVPPEVVASQTLTDRYPGCQQSLAAGEVVKCVLGESTNPVRTVALVGDSHATQWFPAFDELGKEHNWRVLTYTKASCPFTRALRVLEVEADDARQRSCSAWTEAVKTELTMNSDVEEVFMAAYSSAYEWDYAGLPSNEAGSAGFADAWANLEEVGVAVTAISAIPRTSGGDVPDCLAANAQRPFVCATPRSEALPPDVMLAAVKRLQGSDVRYIAVEDLFCDDSVCFAVVGGVIVYMDASHLSFEYSSLLWPHISERYKALRPNS